MFKLIVCLNTRRVIGNDGKLLYHIKNDLANFKSITSGNVVIMGRNTFESLPNKSPLSNRVNIVITSDENYCVDANDDIYIVHSIEDAISMSKSLFYDKDAFVIGGASIYDQFLKKGVIEEMYLTKVYDDAEGDTVFPQYDESEWKPFYNSTVQREGTLGFEFIILKKK